MVLNIQIQNVQHCLEHCRSGILPPLSSKSLYFVQVLASHAGCELHQGHDHGKGSSLDGDKRLVHVDAHSIGNVEEWFALIRTEDAADNLYQQLLGITCAEVEANRFENQSL